MSDTVNIAEAELNAALESAMPEPLVHDIEDITVSLSFKETVDFDESQYPEKYCPPGGSDEAKKKFKDDPVGLIGLEEQWAKNDLINYIRDTFAGQAILTISVRRESGQVETISRPVKLIPDIDE